MQREIRVIRLSAEAYRNGFITGKEHSHLLYTYFCAQNDYTRKVDDAEAVRYGFSSRL